jgi:hypothetical protein
MLAVGDIKCPLCNYYASPHDMKHHMETHWRPTQKRTGETLSIKGDPVLAAKIQAEGGTLHLGGYIYKIYGKLIWRGKET